MADNSSDSPKPLKEIPSINSRDKLYYSKLNTYVVVEQVFLIPAKNYHIEEIDMTLLEYWNNKFEGCNPNAPTILATKQFSTKPMALPADKLQLDKHGPAVFEEHTDPIHPVFETQLTALEQQIKQYETEIDTITNIENTFRTIESHADTFTLLVNDDPNSITVNIATKRFPTVLVELLNSNLVTETNITHGELIKQFIITATITFPEQPLNVDGEHDSK